MKFGDKLIALRKKKGMSQEDLAEKLNVSRQSVSKWESNNTYPETDKIIQICAIFDCSMDDLINDKITDIDKIDRSSKKKENQLNIVFDSLLSFITKTVNMFANMKFTNILKCLIELFIIASMLFLLGAIVINTIPLIFANFFEALPKLHHIVYNIFWSISSLIWIIISIIIIIHIFKIRYLDYFDLQDEKDIDNSKEINPHNSEEISNKNFSTNRQPKIIIRDSNHEPFAFLSVLSNFVLMICRFIAFWFVLLGIGILFALSVTLVVLLPLSIYAELFTGINLALFGLIGFTVIIIYFLVVFCFNKKPNLKYSLIAASILFCTTVIGTGLSVLSIKEYTYISENNYLTKATYTKTITYEDKLFLDFPTTKYVIDDTMPADKITISTDYDKAYHTISLTKKNYYNMPNIELHYHASFVDLKVLYNEFINNLKNDTIKIYGNNTYQDITVTASSETINKLLDNLGHIYLYSKDSTENGYHVEIADSKVELTSYNCDVDYDIYNDSITKNDFCACERTLRQTPYGEKIYYSCDYNSES